MCSTTSTSRSAPGWAAASPCPPTRRWSASRRRLDGAPAGGHPGYTFTWDLNDDGTFGDATSYDANYTWTTSGPHDRPVRITDTGAGGNPSHTKTVTRTINVSAPGTSPRRHRRRRRRASRR